MIKVLHFVSKMDRAGQETFIMNTFRQIDRTKYMYNFLCNDQEEGDYDQEIKELGGSIYYLPPRNNVRGIKKYTEQVKVIADWLINNKDKYDIVHVHTYHALDALAHLEGFRRAGVRNAVIHSHNSSGQHPQIHKFCRKLFRCYNFEKLACSADAAEWMYGHGAVKRGEVTIVLNGINTKEFQFSETERNETRKQLGIESNVVVGHIGRFNQQKNHRFLLEVFSAYKKIEERAVLLLIGKGEDEEKIRQYADELALKESIRFLGVRSDIPDLLSAMDVFTFPSLYEGLSVVLIEAQCNGLNIVCTSNLSPETIITDNMHLLDIDDVDKWAKCISQYAGYRNTDIDVSKVDTVNTSKKLIAVYDRLING